MENNATLLKNKRILLSPLNWGLGHVTRCIPLITELLDNNNEIIICCDAEQELVFRNFFPELWYVNHAGYPFVFKGKGKWERDILRSFFKLNKRLRQEKKELNQLVAHFKPDYILADQRYGFRHGKVPSIFITHQMNLPLRGFYAFAQLQNKFYRNKFNAIWLYDSKSSYLAGELSKTKEKVHYLGLKSRFRRDANLSILYNYVAIITGPEPYSDNFFNLVRQKFAVLNQPTIIIANNTLAKNSFRDMGACKVLINPSFKQMQYVLNASSCIISRCGYTTLMDLYMLEKKAILIPTKGQKEQLYLAKLHAKHSIWNFMTEEDFEKLTLS